jgi:hypothetical protein
MDTSWVRIDLSPRQMEEGAVKRIRAECFRWYMAARTPSGAQLLSRPPGAERARQVAVELHFSPRMASICRDAIASYHPVRTKGSPSGEATLLMGSAPESAAVARLSAVKAAHPIQ